MIKTLAHNFFVLNLLKSDFNTLISCTTRPIRENEVQGTEYHFITNEDFHHLINDGSFIEYREYKTTFNNKKEKWYYGTLKTDIEEDKRYIVILDIDGLETIEEYDFDTDGLIEGETLEGVETLPIELPVTEPTIEYEGILDFTEE
jgi:guanylate kinase